MSDLPTDFDDEVQTRDAKADPPAAEIAKDEDGIPYCVKHHCRMKHASSGKKGSKAAYYKCPVEGCEETGKRIKTNRESSIPADPCTCARCKDSKGKPVVMERDERLSRPFYSILRCPACNATSAPMPRPEFVASHHRARRHEHVPDVGDR